ncbi:MAG: hypothetical protein O2954_04175 [bacterium]|nr:hypothetical protein [bacterium]
MTSSTLPTGFTNHGVPAPVGMSAWGGPVPALDANGRRILVIKLWAGIGKQKAYYLLVDAETGESTQIDPEGSEPGAFSSFLTPDNKFYDTLDEQLIELDVFTQTVQRVGPVPAGITMSFTLGDDDLLYIGMYPNAEILSFNPKTRELINYGPLASETWPQYPSLAMDDQKWIYASIVHQRGNIIAFHPQTRENRQLYPEEKRAYCDAREIWRGTDGKVYCRPDKKSPWYRLYNGQIEELPGNPEVDRQGHTATVTSPGVWPDGSRFTTVDVSNRKAKILDVGAQEPREITFDYSDAGVRIYSLVGGPDGNLYGATGIPLRVFHYDPDTGDMQNWGLAGYGGHVNQWVRQGNKLYGGVYSSGSLLEYDPSQPFEDAEIGQSNNPKLLYGPPEVRDLYGRPHAMLAHPDGEHVLLGGNPARGLVGGGLLIYNIPTGKATVLDREDLVNDQGVAAITPLPNGDLVIGGTTRAATGGTATAKEAIVYRLDWTSKKITAQWTPVPGLEVISDLITGPDGLIYGLAAPNQFFVLNADTGEIVHKEEITAYGPVTGMQAPRTMAIGPDGGIYIVFRDAIARMEPGTFIHREIGRPGEPITAGILIQNNRIYFACGAHLCSCGL